jgi:hypothetical protein
MPQIILKGRNELGPCAYTPQGLSITYVNPQNGSDYYLFQDKAEGKEMNFKIEAHRLTTFRILLDLLLENQAIL